MLVAGTDAAELWLGVSVKGDLRPGISKSFNANTVAESLIYNTSSCADMVMQHNQIFFAFFCGLMLVCGFAVCSELGVAAGETGTISVSTSLMDSNIYIDTYPVGSGYYVGEYGIGTHTISFGKVTGFETPESEIITLEVNETE